MGRARAKHTDPVPESQPADDAIPADSDATPAASEETAAPEPASLPPADPKVQSALDAALTPSPDVPPPSPSFKEPPLEPLPKKPDGEKPDPHFGTPRPIKDASPAPRVVNQFERAPAGLCRYKIACRNYTPQATRYILSTPDKAGETEARRLYVQVQGLDRLLREMARNGRDEIEPPALVVTRLAD